MVFKGQFSLGFLAARPPKQTLLSWRRGLPAGGLFSFFPSFQTWKSFCLTSEQALCFQWPELRHTNQLGKQESCKSSSPAKTWLKPWEKWVSCHVTGWSTWSRSVVLSLVKVNTPLSTNISSAGSGISFASCYIPRLFLKPCVAAVKFCPLWCWRTSTGGWLLISTWGISRKWWGEWKALKQNCLFCEKDTSSLFFPHESDL